MQGSCLQEAFQSSQDVENLVDLAELLHNTQNLVGVAKPFIRGARVVQQIYKWESPTLGIFILALCNIACILLDGWYYVLVSLASVSVLAGLGYSHRKTNLLTKVFPADIGALYGRQKPGTPPNGRPVELVAEFKLLLYLINTVVRWISTRLLQFYSILKWENVKLTIRCYCLLLAAILVGHLVPVRWSCTLIIDAFLLHHPFEQYYILLTRTRSDQGANSEPSGGNSDKGVSGNGMALSAEDESPPNGLPMAEIDPDERSDGASSSGEDTGDSQLSASLSSLNSLPPEQRTGPNKKGMVGKLLDLKKRTASGAGTCTGCNVNFTTILKRRRLCSHCGNQFCARCCGHKVPRALFGATAPAAQTETVAVCFYCYSLLTTAERKKSA